MMSPVELPTASAADGRSSQFLGAPSHRCYVSWLLPLTIVPRYWWVFGGGSIALKSMSLRAVLDG